MNNADWLASFDLLGFLRDTGKYFTVNYLLQKEAVSRRLESEEGISFTEFSYPLLQARDYLELFDRFNCTLQMGGSDQWGNITAGIELVRKLRSTKVHGLVWPLMTTASGTKFGKTEAGTVWLDPQRTSPFRFYQFWLNSDDRDVVRYLKLFTFMSRDEVDAAGERRRPTTPNAARRNARSPVPSPRSCTATSTSSVPSAPPACSSVKTSATPPSKTCLCVFEDAPSTELTLPADGMPLAEMLATVKLVSSRSEAVRLLKSGGVYVNNDAPSTNGRA